MRGWTGVEAFFKGISEGYPAHAGMDQKQRLAGCQLEWLPRPCGDGPLCRSVMSAILLVTPPMRGWTSGRGQITFCLSGYPAHAGMDRSAC